MAATKMPSPAQLFARMFDSEKNALRASTTIDPDKAHNVLITKSPSILTASQLALAANPDRKGLIIYNNSSNSVYIAFGSDASSSQNMTAIIASYKEWIAPLPIYTGPIYAIRNSGSGVLLCTESLP